MFADADTGGAGGDRVELAEDLGGGVGLQIEAIQLRQAAGEEDVDGRPRLVAARRIAGRCRGAQGAEAFEAQAEKPHGTRLQQVPAREERVVEAGSRVRHRFAPTRLKDVTGHDSGYSPPGRAATGTSR